MANYTFFRLETKSFSICKALHSNLSARSILLFCFSSAVYRLLSQHFFRYQLNFKNHLCLPANQRQTLILEGYKSILIDMLLELQEKKTLRWGAAFIKFEILILFQYEYGLKRVDGSWSRLIDEFATTQSMTWA